MADIRKRIANILVTERIAYSVKAWEIAGTLVRELGLTEFTCDNERWWATKVEQINRT